MKNVILDCSLVETTAGLHLQLSELLDLPEYYGGNLDALRDSMKGMAEAKVKQMVLLDAVAEAESIEVTAEEFQVSGPFHHPSSPITNIPNEHKEEQHEK